jgi:uncharacterized protein YcbK (DUF882 family)
MNSSYFKRKEFACKCGCGFATVDVELLDVLENVREHFGSPVTINSACRCDAHNKAVGGADGSKHKLGIAADIVVKGFEPKEVADYVQNVLGDSCGLGRYKTFTHVDVRSGGAARWGSNQ